MRRNPLKHLRMYFIAYRIETLQAYTSMQRINYARDIQPLSAFRKAASALIDQVRQTHRPLVLTRNGKSVAVVIDAGDFERLMERIELLEDIQQARTQAERGETVPHEQALEYLTSRLGK